MAIRWNEEMRQYIVDRWATETLQMIAAGLALPLNAVRSQAYKMGLRDPVPPAAPQPAPPPPEPPPILCPGWTHDYRFQLAPGDKPPPLFSAVKIGCDLDGRPWEARL
jgi:hypothetical protein